MYLTQRRRERTQRDHQMPVASETQQSEKLVVPRVLPRELSI